MVSYTGMTLANSSTPVHSTHSSCQAYFPHSHNSLPSVHISLVRNSGLVCCTYPASWACQSEWPSWRHAMARCVSEIHSLESAYKEPSSQGAGPGCTKTIWNQQSPFRTLPWTSKLSPISLIPIRLHAMRWNMILLDPPQICTQRKLNWRGPQISTCVAPKVPSTCSNIVRECFMQRVWEDRNRLTPTIVEAIYEHFLCASPSRTDKRKCSHNNCT